MADSHTTPPPIPRPQNAWILYRTDKSRVIGRKAQATVSKEISKMWRNESKEVKAYYERLADEKKQEHSMKYPDYRFQPVKREQKEKIREQKRLERERKKELKQQARSQTQHSLPLPLPLPAPAPVYYAAQTAQYGPCGPSPPISAAASPESSHIELPDSFPQTPVSIYASPPMPPSNIYGPIVTPANDFNSEDWQTQTMPTQSEYLEFNIPQTSYDQTTWSHPSSDFDGMFMASGDSNIYQLDNFDPQTLLQHPGDNLEITFPPFDLSSLDASTIPPLNDLGLFEQQPQTDLASLFTLFDPAQLPPPPTENFGEYINLDGPSPEAPQPSPYVPPSGAVHSSSRRVGGVWARPSSPMTSPIESNSQWTVHA